ncbi:serine repeat antigen 8, putative [Plasmodium sp. gorilla clade G2]|uniref:serine repeat antigen 8, putative n=1 Tax=Plasmodium sp. gorilla clade G2 TaxID=880535 RepID=UPI000D2C4EA8|nr:serine repeat antigen 8, putative [Plasmodium sp. gorilla clade G2]SOV20076.1 serine repeat antigen 8, putative [Plasmodium sp. gorilla clade G2]
MLGMKSYILFLLVILYQVKRVYSNILINCFGVLHCNICRTILRNCFLSGTADLEKCISCEEKYYKISPCTQNHESFLMSKSDMNNTFVELKDHDELTDEKMKNLITEIIEIAIDRHTLGLHDFSSATDEYKEKIKMLCMFSNYKDNYENANNHKQAKVEIVEEHINKIVETYINEENNMEHMKDLLKNPALCLKNPNHWIKDRAGFKDDDKPSVGIIPERKLFRPYDVKVLKSSLYASSTNCDRQFCDRFSDSNECEHRIRVLNQGKCGNCWVFASSVVIEAYRCRKGLGFAEPSIKYVTLCKNKYLMDIDNNPFGHYNDNICKEGGHLSYYLETLEKSNMLPTSYDVPYNEPIKGTECPDNKETWSNIWKGVNLMDKIYGGYIYHGYFKVSFKDYVFSNRTNDLINIIKDYIIQQGSLFVSMEVTDKLTFDHDGTKVMMSCENNDSPDHALVLIGYGDYIKTNGKKSSYWLLRNSWGSQWGDKGNFKLDMYGPNNCNGRVLYNAFPLLLNMSHNPIDAPLPKDLASTDTRVRYRQSDFNQNRNRNNYPSYDKNNNNSYERNELDPYNKNDDNNYNPYNKAHYNDRTDDSYYDNNDDYNNAHIRRNTRRFKKRIIKYFLYARIGNTVYKRTILSKRKDEYKEPYSCLRTFSFEKGSDLKCRSNCEMHIDKCKHYSSIGECLIRRSPNYKCVYCGM